MEVEKMNRRCCKYDDTVVLKIPTRNSFCKYHLSKEEKDKLISTGNHKPPITGHLNQITYVVINNIDSKSLSKRLPETYHYSCNKNYVTKEAYDRAVDDMLIKKSSTYAQLFGSVDELTSRLYNSDGTLNKLSFVQTDILHNCGSIASVIRDNANVNNSEFVYIRISRHDKFFDLVMKAAGDGELFANARYTIIRNKLPGQKMDIFSRMSLITFDIILPDKYCCEYEKARISELKI